MSQLPLTPVYQQVANALRAAIVRQDGNRPVRLPSEEELATTHGVARGTIRQALRILAADGLITQARRRGTLTIPTGIALWRKMHEAQIVRVLYSGVRPLTVPSPETFCVLSADLKKAKGSRGGGVAVPFDQAAKRTPLVDMARAKG